MVFTDLRKAFDVVDHQVLLTKLLLYRVSDASLSWFESGKGWPSGEIT